MMYRSFAGGFALEASLCGTLAVASGFIGLFTEDRQNELVKELFDWYKQAELPVYNPDFPDHVITVAESTLCYDSVSKFIEKEGVAFGSKERSSRCAGVAAEVVRTTATILNREFA
jgi:hypothetical protein